MTRFPLVLAGALLTVTAASSAGTAHHVNAVLLPVDGSGVTGIVHITALPEGGAQITVVAKGLMPGAAYLSLYYDNDTCALEPYSEDDIIGNYIGRPSGVAATVGEADDDLDEINSVSVRDADFNLLACATIEHPSESARLTPRATRSTASLPSRR